MKKIILFLNILIIVFGTIAFGDNTKMDMWKFEKEILINEGSGYKSIILDKEVYKYSKNDLSDIRIVDQNYEFVPYYIESKYEEIEERNSTYAYDSEKILVFNKNDDLFIDFKLLSENTDKDFIVNQLDLNLDLSSNFAKDIIIYGSYDNEKWQSIKRDNIFNISDANNSKTSIYFDEDFKYSYYRISILQNIEDVQVEGIVALKKEEIIVNSTDYAVEEKLEYKIDQEDSSTIITISNPNRLKIFKLQVMTKDLFNREYKLGFENGYILNTGTINSNKDGNMINIYNNDNREESEELNLIIYNKDDKPIHIDEIVVSYYVDILVFKANEDSNYRMLVGNENATVPSYDITSYKTSIEGEKKETAVFGNTLEKKIEGPTSNNINMKLILNIVVIITSLFLIIIIFKSTKKI